MKKITCERCGKQELRATKARFCLECSNNRGKAYYADHREEILARYRYKASRKRAKK